MRTHTLALFGAALLGALVSTNAVAQEPIMPDEPYQELPILTWQEEMELQSTVRQVLFNAYLPLLQRNTFYRGVHNDAIPNQMRDWDYQRPDVQRQLISRQDVVDQQRRGHAGLPDAEINALISRKKDFRQEEFERLITVSPRFEDLVIEVKRLQPLGNEVFRIDFEVRTKSNGNVETTKFDSVDIVRQGGTWLLPMKILLDIAPVARAQQAIASGQPLDIKALADNFIAIAQNTIKDVVPFDIPFITSTPE